jgi:fanconi anemia group J protein
MMADGSVAAGAAAASELARQAAEGARAPAAVAAREAAGLAEALPLSQRIEARPAPPTVGGTQLNVRGVRVSFPFAAYRSQLAMMHSVITVAKNSTHALVESPTGTGKSMALLCAALAWQRDETAASEREFTQFVADLTARGLVDDQMSSIVAKREPLPQALGRIPVTIPLSALRGEEAAVYATNAGFLAASASLAEAEVDGALSQYESCEVVREACRRIVDAGLVAPDVEKSHARLVEAMRVRADRSAAVKGEQVLVESSRVNVEGGAATEVSWKRGAAMDDDEDFVQAKKARDASWQNRGEGRRGAARGDAAKEEVPENANLPTQLQNMDLDARLRGEAGWSDELGCTEDLLRRRRSGRVFYSSRTHAQLTQVIRELKISGYKPRMTMLASRNEYCLNRVARASGDTNDACDKMLKDSACHYFSNKDDVANVMRSRGEPFDIEDINMVGQTHKGCTYFAAVDLATDAELILCPYNYLLDANIRRAREIDVTGDVLIFDEAHNIEDHAREAASFTQEFATFRNGVEEVKDLTVGGRIGRPGSALANAYLNLQELMAAAAALCDLVLDSGRMRQEGTTEVATFERDEVVEMLEKVNINEAASKRYQSDLTLIQNSRDEEYEYTPQDMYEGEEDMDAGAVFFRRAGIGSRGRNVRNEDRETRPRRSSGPSRPGCKCLNIGISLCTSLSYALSNPESFILALQRVSSNWEQKTELSLWCLNASVPFAELSSKARSIIVTSGTLTPLESFAGELNLKFSIAKSLPHVVDVQKQVYTSVVATGPGLVRMDTTYKNASNFQFQDSLGAAILEYCKIIPGGVLIFFPSYRLLNLLVQRWESSGCWEQLEGIKGLVVRESSGRGREFNTSIAAYNAAANSPDGAVMLGVCRGKISEGLDFKDAAARGVLIIGIPYPSAFCPQLRSKRAWNDRERRESERKDLLSGSAWYDMQAFRALNQAVGRCVRHRRDYGAIVLLDQRFRAASVAKQLPRWVRGAMRAGAPATHEATLLGLNSFFASVEDNLPPP